MSVLTPSPGGAPAVLLRCREVPRDAQTPPPHPAFRDRPEKAGSESEVPRGCRGQPGEIHRSESLLRRGRRDSGQHKPRQRRRPSEGLLQGTAGLLSGALRRWPEAQPMGGTGISPLGTRTDFPRCTQTGSGKPSIQQSRVCVTVSVRLQGWSPMRRVIPKLFLITFSIGGE